MTGRTVGSVLVGLALAACVPLVSCDDAAAPVASASKVRRIAMVARAPTTDFWETLHTGASETARAQHGVLLNYRGPGVDGDSARQESLVHELVAGGLDALAIGPADQRALDAALTEARGAKIPVIVVDRDMTPQPGDGVAAVVTSNDAEGGAMAARALGETLKTGKVLLFRHDKSNPNTTLREQGFTDALTSYSGLTLADPRVYSGTSLADAKKTADQLLSEQLEINAVFCPSEVSAHGMVVALREHNRNGKVKVIAFESSSFLAEALALGDVDAVIVPDPGKIGKLVVQAAIDAIDGKPVTPRQQVPVLLATRANMRDDAVMTLLIPVSPVPAGGP